MSHGNLGKTHSEETREKIRLARLNQKPQIIGKYGITEESYRQTKEAGLRWCSDCKSFLSIEAFYVGEGRRKTRCISCWAIRSKTYRETRTPEQKEVLNLKKESQRILRVYGVSLEWRKNKLEEQEGHCALCPATESFNKALGIDHNHETKKVRGLLCNSCNMLLDVIETGRPFGQAFDQFEKNWYETALKYLEKYNG